jgi:hypothetical protein
VALNEILLRTLFELIKHQDSGLTQLEIDQVAESLQRTRRDMLDKLRHYRDRLDLLKVELGLSPHAPVVLDRSGLATFRDIFEAALRWTAGAARDLAELNPIVNRLPHLKDVEVDGYSLLKLARSGNHVLLEDVMKAGADVAIRARGVAVEDEEKVQIELQVRRRIRKLLDLSVAYQIEKRKFVVLLRLQDLDLAKELAKPRREARISKDQAMRLIEIRSQVLENQDRIVALWAFYGAERLELCRDLGTLPYADWDAFLGQFAPKPGDVEGPQLLGRQPDAVDLPPPAPPRAPGAPVKP